MVNFMYDITSYEFINNNSNKTILFLHGWGCNKSYMIPIANKIKSANNLIIDLPGFKDNISFDNPQTIYDYINIIYDFLIRNNYQINYIIGHSFGGKLAVLLAHKLKIQSLFLFAPSIYNKPRFLFYYIKVYLYKFLKKINPNFKILNKFGSKDYKSLSNIMKKTMSNVINENIEKQLKNLNIPIILFFGKKDKITPMYLANKIKRNAKDCILFKIDGNHFAYLKNSNYITSIIEKVINL